ncbi:MAG TPA: glycosyltransferase family 39 protein, partial [Patescibacteria group bacterium]
MKKFFLKHFSLIFLIAIGLVIRTINIGWGSPFFFHPDERNIASSITQLSFPTQMNPHFFAYGSLPIYVSYFLSLFYLNFSTKSVPFDLAILIMRFISAVLSVSIIPSIYYIGTKLKNSTTGIIAAVLTTFSTGLIQFAHFGTFEIWLTFLTLWFFYFCIQLLKKQNIKNVFLCSVFFGLLLAIKISSLALLIIPLSIILFSFFSFSSKLKFIKYCCLSFIIFIFISFLIVFVSNPFSFFDYVGFLGSIHYETAVALGTLPVFYTNEFIHSVPILFQFLYIYPFLLNPVITILFLICFFFVLLFAIGEKSKTYFLLLFFFLITFLSQAFLFVKWTRYIVPTLPFIYLIIALVFTYFIDSTKNIISKISQGILFFAIIVSCIISLAYTLTVYASQDSRIYAANLAAATINKSTPILSEIYDLGIISFNPYFSNIKLFDFYNLSSFSLPELSQNLTDSQYIIEPSQ